MATEAQQVQTHSNWLDRAIGYVAPAVALRRLRARAAASVLARHYEAASSGRRTQGWRRSTGDANAVIGPVGATLRGHARDLVRNNGHAESALRTIATHVCGATGIVAKAIKAPAVQKVWNAWANSTDCDSDGRNNLAGLQKLIMRSVAESGEVLVRRRFRRVEDGLAIPLQLQVLEADYLDTLKFGAIEVRNSSGQRVGSNKIIAGVEFDFLGRRVAYWLFREHPGAPMGMVSAESFRVPAESVLHVYRQDRPGQVRGATWFANVLLKFKDFDEFDDATLMKQKIAACLAVITSDTDGTAPPIGTAITDQSPEWDSLEPGLIANVPPGRTIEVVQPPSVREYPDYTRVTLHQIAAGLGVPYEELTGDYSAINFSSARMSRIAHWDNVEEWRWLMLAPQFLDPVWRWAMEAAALMGTRGALEASALWTAPPPPLVDPDKEGTALRRLVRCGFMSLSEALRGRGYDPRAVFDEIAEDNDVLDKLGIVLDSDPRKTSEAGLTQARPTGTVNPSPTAFDDGEPEPEPEQPAAPAKPSGSTEEEEEDDDA